jgi:TRAP-type mannitol/chloroaromatic compound transport system permease small subunit
MNAAAESLSSSFSPSTSTSPLKTLIRTFASFLVAAVLLYLVSRTLIHWYDWPSLSSTLGLSEETIETSQKTKGIILLLIYAVSFGVLALFVKRTPNRSLNVDAESYKKLSYFIIRAAFWSVFLIGFADAVISFLRVEELLIPIVGQELSDKLDQPISRGHIVHYPLLVLSLIIAWFSKSLGFIWLALLVVIAEFTIVITRFVFSYEQAFMGDLVRFWYASFFLFASAYSLIEGGHVRVDVLYARINNRKKAWVNALGSLLLGLPVCWTILHYGMSTRQSSLIAPIVSFEVSPTGYGMYIKYLMAAFLIVYAVSMAIIFVSYFLSSCAYLFGDPDAELPAGGEH